MKFRKVSILLIFVMVLSLVSGCSFSGRGSGTAKKGDNAAAPGSSGSKVKLSVAYYYTCENMVEAAITAYSDKKVEFNREMIEQNADYSVTAGKLESLMARTLAGDGPDIIIEAPIFKLARNYKTLKSGLYCDLNELIKNDGTFKYDDYYKNILDSGVINGKRYVMPLVFSAFGFLSTKEALQKGDIQIDEASWDWDRLVKTADNFAEKNKGNDKYFLNPIFDTQILNVIAGYQVDYESNSSHFNSQEFRRIMEDLLKIRPAIYPKDKDNNTIVSAPYYIQNEKTVLALDIGYSIFNPIQLSNMYDELKEKQGRELAVIPFPAFKETGGYPCSIVVRAGISSTCKHKKEAFGFIKTLLMPEITGDSLCNFFGFPVSKAGFEKIISSSLPGGLGRPRPQGAFDVIEKMVSNMEKCKFDDNQIDNIVNKHYTSFIEGKETLDQAVKKMDEDVYLYLNE